MQQPFRPVRSNCTDGCLALCSFQNRKSTNGFVYYHSGSPSGICCIASFFACADQKTRPTKVFNNKDARNHAITCAGKTCPNQQPVQKRPST